MWDCEHTAWERVIGYNTWDMAGFGSYDAVMPY